MFSKVLYCPHKNFHQIETLTAEELCAGARTALEEVASRMRAPMRVSVESILERVPQTPFEELTVKQCAILSEEYHEEIRQRTRSRGALRVAIEKAAVFLAAMELEICRDLEFPEEVLKAERYWLLDSFEDILQPVTRDEQELSWRELAAQMRNSWLRMIGSEWRGYNDQYLSGRLRPPIFQLTESEQTHGRWDGHTRTLSLSAWHIATHSWDEVRNTLQHEMAHQVVQEIFRESGDRPHGEMFARACRMLRCDATATSRSDLLGRKEDSGDPRDRVVVKIQKLLALGRSSNEHEASLAVKKASELLLKFNIDLSSDPARKQYRNRSIGPFLSRIQEYHHTVANILSDHFFVRVIWVHSYDARRDKTGRRLEIIGAPENLEIAEYVHDFLHNAMERIWDQHRKSPAYAKGRKPQFYAGMTRGFRNKLDEQRRHIARSRDLVWLGDTDLAEHYRYLYPRVHSIRGSGVTRGADYHHGVEKGREIQLHHGVKEQAKEHGGYLPPA